MSSFIKETFAQWMAQFQDSGQSITKELMKREERYKLTKEKPSPKMTVEKPFGKASFGAGDYAKAPYYLKELQTKRIKSKCDLILDKLGDINKIVTLLEKKLNDLKQS